MPVTWPRRQRRPSTNDDPSFRQSWDFLANELPPDPSHRRPCTLGPPEAFRDEPAPDWLLELWADHDPLAMGPASSAVRRRIALSCAGWNRKPTAAEFYAAIHEPSPDSRQQALISMTGAIYHHLRMRTAGRQREAEGP